MAVTIRFTEADSTKNYDFWRCDDGDDRRLQKPTYWIARASVQLTNDDVDHHM
jgi:hypothetical protein